MLTRMRSSVRMAVPPVCSDQCGTRRAWRTADGQTPAMELRTVQELMETTYGARDRSRGLPAAVAWLTEELGELARAVRKGSREEQLHELGDVLAWLASIANQLDASLDDAFARYASGCPYCGRTPCRCDGATARDR